jgi:predicted ArsR family transcriptional regulator
MKTYSENIAQVSTALSDPTRRQIMEYVLYAEAPLSVRDIAEYFGLHANAARMHLEKLVKGGLLRVVRQRGERGGRPANLYDTSGEDWDISLPPRSYKLLADILASSIFERGEDRDKHICRESYRRGREEAIASSSPLAYMAPGGELQGVIAAWSDEVKRRGHRANIKLTEAGLAEATFISCPFGEFSERYPGLVCEIHRCLEEGFLSLAGAYRLQATEKRCTFILRHDKTT